jgi:hypothetical protein
LKPVTHSPLTASVKRDFTEQWVKSGQLSLEVMVQSEICLEIDGEQKKYGDEQIWE